MVIPRHQLARDRAGVVILTILTIGLPARVWTVLTMPTAATYAAFPLWAQTLILAAYAGQLWAEAWGSARTRMIAAFVSACAAGGAAWLFWSSDTMSGGTATWAAAAMLQLWAFGNLSRLTRLEKRHATRVV